MATIFSGYSSQVWSAVYTSFQYFLNALGTTSSPGATVPLAQTVYYTAYNGLEALNLTRIANAWQDELNLLVQAEIIPLTLDPSLVPYCINRVRALRNSIPVLLAQQPVISLNSVITNIVQRVPAISDPNLLLWLNNFLYEPTPIALSSANFISEAQLVVDSFTTIASGLKSFLGSKLSPIYDVCVRFTNTAQVIANILQSFTSGPVQLHAADQNLVLGTESGQFVITESDNYIKLEPGALSETGLGLSNAWNQLVATPALLLNASLITTAPYTLQIQQDLLLRYLIITIMNELTQFLLVMRQPFTPHINQALLRMGDSLMDVAARNTSSFENWAVIAATNGLIPPYVGATSSPGVAAWGNRLLLPAPGPVTSAEGVVPSYDVNFLGVDEYVGPINGNMPNWSGDYQLISGYKNLRWALGRRIQTTLGALIYHSAYGCRIPPEVGNIQNDATVGHIAAFGQAALQQDPRVARVISAKAQSLPNFAVAFQGAVQPGGFGSTALQLNEVILPTSALQISST